MLHNIYHQAHCFCGQFVIKPQELATVNLNNFCRSRYLSLFKNWLCQCSWMCAIAHAYMSVVRDKFEALCVIFSSICYSILYTSIAFPRLGRPLHLTQEPPYPARSLVPKFYIRASDAVPSCLWTFCARWGVVLAWFAKRSSSVRQLALRSFVPPHGEGHLLNWPPGTVSALMGLLSGSLTKLVLPFSILG
jgi:hypothetical protein